MVEKKDRRGTPKGHSGNIPHVRNDVAATMIERFASYGMPQRDMVDFLIWAPDALGLDLGGQGYSPATLQKHYREELDRGRAPAKEMLLRRVYSMAMMEDVPEGVSPDKAYTVSADKLMSLLNILHGIMPHQSLRHGGPAGQPFPLSLIEAALTPEERDELARIVAKLEAAREL